MSELDQLVKILKAIASQQKANAMAISQLTTNLENLTTQMEEDRHQQRVHAYGDRLEKDKLRAMFTEIIGVMALHLTDDDDEEDEESQGFDFELEESADHLDLGLEQSAPDAEDPPDLDLGLSE
ncbi:hypothetical protein [Pantanalinema sp. GBBB05]|uniref:hypothetical protein n=1 Tax=Pantanalinema sp. GBBB05 TaxID=2604139 RepID=UPI001DA1A29F|nr:hypothetical protein [Pantanalinema sp. GBBB05]